MTLSKVVALLSTLFKNLLPQSSLTITSAEILDIGLARENNEDSYLSLPAYQLWAVADGMGGCEGGEIASAIAIKQLKSSIVAGQALADAIEQCDQTIEQAALDGFGADNMGSTIVALQIKKHCYQIAWVGDSRAYLFRSELACLSKDHSYVQLLLDKNLITEAEAETHPFKSAITQALGSINESVTVDLVSGEIQAGDIFLLCSDGLSGRVSFEHMEQILGNQNLSLAEKAQQLLDMALLAGGTDNIAIILIAIVQPSTIAG